MHDYPLKKLTRDIIKQTLYFILQVSHHPSEKKNIMLFSTKRGGSTWLARLICAADPKLRSIDHAVGWVRADYRERSFLPHSYLGQYIVPDENLTSYMAAFDSGKLITKTPWNPFRKDFVRVSNRLLYKITEGKALINWFDEMGKYQIIYQLRHPISNSLSIKNLHWGLTAEAYLENEYFTLKYMNSELMEYSQNILHNGPDLKKYVLNWVLENLIPLKSYHRRKWLTISYEELVMYPKELIKIISEYLGLTDTTAMGNAIFEKSKSSVHSSKEKQRYIETGNKDKLISGWRKNISRELEEDLLSVLYKFDLDTYKPGRDLPSEKYLNIPVEIGAAELEFRSNM